MADIHRIGLAFIAAMLACVSQASWHWPFGSDSSKQEPPRLSELMRPASQLIDDAADLAADGKNEEAVEKYREALKKLDKIEAENPQRVKSPEFATLRNKRAYVGAAIDSLLLTQVKSNARAIAVSDTTELEKKLVLERPDVLRELSMEMAEADVERKTPTEAPKAVRPVAPPVAISRREQAMRLIAIKDFEAAELVIGEMLKDKPLGAAALNLQAVMEIEQGKLEAARKTLDRCIAANPRSYFAYYNLCELMLRQDDRVKAKQYYRTGRIYGGPRKTQLEAVLK